MFKVFSLSYKILRTYIISLFDREITFYASSLSFYTLFTLIPILLITISIATSFDSFDIFYTNIKSFIMQNILPVSSNVISEYMDSFMQNSTKLGLIGVTSVIISSILFFQNFEYIVNKIFKTKPRSFWQSLTTYWTLMTLTPIALTFSFYLSAQFQDFLGSNRLTQTINFVEIFPYLIIWALFFMIYKISANINISNRAALISSFFASLTWYLAKLGFIAYIIDNKTYTTIYGSFSTLIFFFLWIYLSWMIFIYGLKLCHTIETVGKTTKTKKKK